MTPNPTIPPPDLMRALGRLIRGLSALFWGMPLALLACVHVGLKNRLEVQSYDFLLPTACTALLLYGVHLLGDFQRQEQIWMEAIDRAKMLAMVLVGLSPFVYWRVQAPDVTVFELAVMLFAVFGLLFLYCMNHVLQRLVAMLPDETLRAETRFFSHLNQYLLAAIPITITILAAVISLSKQGLLPRTLLKALSQSETVHHLFFLFLTLVPVAMTMALIWKTKEVVFHAVFGGGKS